MSDIILNILCEGKTEERFVITVLKPFLRKRNICVKQRLLITSKKNNSKGGIISYQQVERDLSVWAKECRTKINERHYFTTMFDLYALPNDFPEKDKADKIHDKYERIKTIEIAFFENLKGRIDNFIPYIQLHEIEALLFCDIDKLIAEFPKSKKEIEKLKNVLSVHQNNPELINDGTQTAPSKRIEKALEGKYRYNKPNTIEKVTDIDILREKCRHFNDWISKLEKLND